MFLRSKTFFQSFVSANVSSQRYGTIEIKVYFISELFLGSELNMLQNGKIIHWKKLYSYK